jgi:hypothetical protein
LGATSFLAVVEKCGSPRLPVGSKHSHLHVVVWRFQ